MTDPDDNTINADIAQWMGWKKIPHEYYVDRIAFEKDGEIWASIDLPNYTADLNAMHEAEMRLTGGQGLTYFNELESICQLALVEDGTDHWLVFRTVSAPAQARARALWRTVCQLD